VPQLQLRNDDSVSYPSVSLPSTSKSKAPLKHLSNPAQALAHLEKHNAKLAGMTPEQRKEAEERERWAKAEERAKGGKVADQEGTLKRAVKRLEKKKSKSGKEW
jgi:flagellar biosynthesis/type III secretory pathway protein FliH